MARIEWIKHELDNWAVWKVQEESGGLGFAKQSAFLRDAGQSGYHEAHIDIRSNDAAVMNQAVESLRMTRSHLYETLQLVYVGTRREAPLGIVGAAQRMGKAKSTICANLGHADYALAQWYSERSSKAKQSQQGTFTT